jgi:hypothetical protein
MEHTVPWFSQHSRAEFFYTRVANLCIASHLFRYYQSISSGHVRIIMSRHHVITLRITSKLTIIVWNILFGRYTWIAIGLDLCLNSYFRIYIQKLVNTVMCNTMIWWLPCSVLYHRSPYSLKERCFYAFSVVQQSNRNLIFTFSRGDGPDGAFHVGTKRRPRSNLHFDKRHQHIKHPHQFMLYLLTENEDAQTIVHAVWKKEKEKKRQWLTYNLGKICWRTPLFSGLCQNTLLKRVFAKYHYNFVTRLLHHTIWPKTERLNFSTQEITILPTNMPRILRSPFAEQFFPTD